MATQTTKIDGGTLLHRIFTTIMMHFTPHYFIVMRIMHNSIIKKAICNFCWQYCENSKHLKFSKPK